MGLTTLISGEAAQSHEVDPAYLQVNEVQQSVYQILWKQPFKEGKRLRLRPEISQSCERSNSHLQQNNGSTLHRWTETCKKPADSIQIVGLNRTLTDVFAEVTLLNGSTWTTIIRAQSPTLHLNKKNPSTQLSGYFRLGVEHILFGFDHLFFVLGLCLLSHHAKIIWTLTSFTIAHSITLAMTTLTDVKMPAPPVEAVIALSLVFLAREVLRVQQQSRTLIAGKLWVVAFGFGLLHGFGFAGALSEIGLPVDQRLWALAIFNLGVEFGQILFVIAIFSVTSMLWALIPKMTAASKTATAYFIGIAGIFWTFERILSF